MQRDVCFCYNAWKINTVRITLLPTVQASIQTPD